MPRRRETPTIVVDLVSTARCDRLQEYELHWREFREVGVREYWLIDRFRRNLTVRRSSKATRTLMINENDAYGSPLLPGFEQPLARLLALCEDWED